MTDTRRNVTDRAYQSKRAMIRNLLLVALVGALVGLSSPLLLSEEEGRGKSSNQNGIWTQDMKTSDALQGW